MKKLLPGIFLIIFSFSFAHSQPDRELRAVWLTSVYNIDWPHSTAVPANNQKIRLIEILDILHEANFNAVFFQVRPNADALYESAYEPWSHWITGTRGQVPEYDPLALVIEEAHKRGMEVHAWMNPYRFENVAGQYANLPGDYSQTHPELIINYSNKTYFNPGIPATTQLIKEIIGDLISNYDLDGVIFDDYFYPSNLPSHVDQETYQTYGTDEFVQQYYAINNIGNFRRASVNNMIREVNDTIKALRPAMAFGVSPAGIYSMDHSAAAQWGTTLPSGITGWDPYNAINCDPLAWLNEGSVDYISPQLYWKIGGGQDFVTLTEWWGYQAARYDLHSYPSLGSYRLYSNKYIPTQQVHGAVTPPAKPEKSDTDKSNWVVEDIGAQIIANRNSNNNLAQGFVFYNTRSVVNPQKDLAGYLAEDLFSQKTIFPYLEWLPSTQPGAPQISEIANLGGQDHLAAITTQQTPASRFLLYGWEEMPTKDNKYDPDFMQIIFGKEQALFYKENNHYFSVAEFMPNRELGYESPVMTFIPIEAAVIQTPAAGSTICHNASFTWSEVEPQASYQLQFARAQNPSQLAYESPVIQSPNYQLASGILKGQKEYVFRVRAATQEGVSYSQWSAFHTGYPASTTVNSPANQAQNVNLSTTVQWSSVPDADHYHLQIATDDSFQNLVVDQESVSFNFLSIELSDYLTDHFVRVKAVNDCGMAAWSAPHMFTTKQGTGLEAWQHHVLKAYPNPAQNSCKVNFPSAISHRTISWYAVNGQLVDKQHRSNHSLTDTYDISHLPAGFYTVKVRTPEGQTFVFKLIVTR